MKKLLGLLLLVLTLTVMPKAHAATASAVEYRTVYNCCNVKLNTWFEVVTSTAKAIKGITIANSGTTGLLVALGASGSEVAQLIFPNQSSLVPIYLPFVASQSQRISVQSLGSTGGVGEIQLNLFYN